MSAPRVADPSWYASRRPAAPPRPTLDGEIDAEVAVIGGGLTGLSAALELAGRGVDVVVLEAGRIGDGASGRNGGQALQGLAAGMDVVERAVGLAAAQQIWTMSCEALALLKQRIAHHAIDCDLAAKGYVYAATHAGQLADLAAWRDEAAAQYGYRDFRLLDRDALAAHVNSEAYVGGLFDPNEVHLDPLAYTLGLARAAEHAGARLFERSAATGRQAEAGGWRVRTAGGSVRCRQLLVAVNASAAGIAPQLARHFLPVDSFIVATEPLDAGLAASLLPSGAAVADCNRVLNYFRLGADGHLLFGGRAGGTARDRAEDTRRRMLAVFPQLEDRRIDYAWGGQVDVTPHKLPHFGRLADGAYFAQGFCGHGLALTGLAGLLVAEAMTGQPRRFDLFAALPQYRLPTQLPGFARAAVTLGMAWYQLRDKVDLAWYRD